MCTCTCVDNNVSTCVMSIRHAIIVYVVDHGLVLYTLAIYCLTFNNFCGFLLAVFPGIHPIKP